MNIKTMELMCDLLKNLVAKVEELEVEIEKLRKATEPKIKPGPDDYPPGWVTGETP